MDSELKNQDLTNDNKYRFAGYCAIISSLLSLPFLVVHLSCAAQVGQMTIIVPLNISLAVISAFCSLYAFYRFKCYLNEYYEFHDIDKIVMPLIILSVIGTLAGIFNSTVASFSQAGPGLRLLSLMTIFAISITAGIIGIIFSIKLLSLPVELHGMLRPYVYISIAAAICFMLFFLGPIGVILGAVTDFMLGMILLKPAEEPAVEFV